MQINRRACGPCINYCRSNFARDPDLNKEKTQSSHERDQCFRGLVTRSIDYFIGVLHGSHMCAIIPRLRAVEDITRTSILLRIGFRLTKTRWFCSNRKKQQFLFSSEIWPRLKFFCNFMKCFDKRCFLSPLSPAHKFSCK